MRRGATRAAIAAIVLAASSHAPAAEQSRRLAGEGWQCYPTMQAFTDARIRIGRIEVNDFILQETENRATDWGFASSTSRTVFLDYSITNRGTREALAYIQVAGFDAADKLLFAMDASPRNNFAFARETHSFTGAALVREGQLGQTVHVCVHVMAAENRDVDPRGNFKQRLR